MRWSVSGLIGIDTVDAQERGMEGTVVWKFELQLTDTQSMEMPAGAKLLSVANQNGVLSL